MTIDLDIWLSLNLTSNPLSTNLLKLDVLVFKPNFSCQKTSMEKIPWHLTRETAQLHYHSPICNA